MQWSQERFAEELGMRQPAVSKIEKSKTLPELQTAIRIAIVLGCSLDDLLVGVDAAYDARIKTIRSVQNSTDRTEQHTIDSALPAFSEGSHESIASSSDLDTLASRRHEAVAHAVELLRLLLGPAGLDAAVDAAQSRRRKVG
jgi:transcriptional regulator with XRE-family HTH domain